MKFSGTTTKIFGLRSSQGFHVRIWIVPVLCFLVFSALSAFAVITQTQSLTESLAIQQAQRINESLATFRTLYTSEVVVKARAHGMEVTHDHVGKPGAIPLPATLSMEIGKTMGEAGSGVQSRLYSPYPFPWRRESGGLRDDFQHKAWEELSKKPETPVYDFQNVSGVPSLRYATADLMREACVKCHNTHPDSPRLGWKVGDLRGVLEVSIPLDQASGAAHSAMTGTVMLLVIINLIAAGGVGIVVTRLRRGSDQLENAVERRTIALKESEEFNRTLVQSAHEAVITMNTAGNITGWNSKAEEIFGWTSDEATGKELVSLIIPERFRALHQAGLKRFLSTGVGKVLNQQLELSALRKDGSEFVIAITLSHFQARREQHFCGFIQDISQRHAAEIERNRLLSIVESSTDLIGMTDLKGKILYLNTHGRGILGVRPDEDLTGKKFKQFQSPETEEFIRRTAIPEVLRGGTWRGETEFVNRDGKRIPVLMLLQLQRDQAGNPQFIFTISRDISERVKFEEQLRQSQKMEAIGTLAGCIAHDFNNLLLVINGYSLSLMEKLGDNEKLRFKAEEINKAGNRAASLTNQLLTFSRKQKAEIKIVDPNKVVANVAQMLERLIGENIELKINQQNGIGMIKVDQGQLEQVILNLSVNARDAMPSGGTLTITTQAVSIDESMAAGLKVQPGSYVMLAVSDTGTGIPKDILPRIFEPFFTSKEVGKGTGMGLSIVHGVVKQNEGGIAVYSEVGQGTTFKIYFPCFDEEAIRRHTSKHPQINVRGHETILIVEDEVEVGKLIEETLVEHGYRVLRADNGKRALDIIQGEGDSIDLVLTDVVMPQMGGVQLEQWVSQHLPGMRMILMSGYTDVPQEVEDALKRNHAFLSKPFSQGVLLETIRTVLDHRDN